MTTKEETHVLDIAKKLVTRNGFKATAALSIIRLVKLCAEDGNLDAKATEAAAVIRFLRNTVRMQIPRLAVLKMFEVMVDASMSCAEEGSKRVESKVDEIIDSQASDSIAAHCRMLPDRRVCWRVMAALIAEGLPAPKE